MRQFWVTAVASLFVLLPMAAPAAEQVVAAAKPLLTLQRADGSWVNDNGRWMEMDPVRLGRDHPGRSASRPVTWHASRVNKCA